MRRQPWTRWGGTHLEHMWWMLQLRGLLFYCIALLFGGEAVAARIDVGVTVHTAECMRRLERSTGSGESHAWSWDAWGDKKLHYTQLHFERPMYQAMRDVAIQVRALTKDAPVVGVGRSPFAITTILSIIGRQSVTDLALSDFRHRPPTRAEAARLPEHYTKQAKRFEPLTDAGEQTLFSHFDEQIGAFVKQQRGPIYLVDIGESGASLFATARYLNAYARLRRYDVEFKTIVVTKPFFSANVDEMSAFFDVKPQKIVVTNNVYVERILTPAEFQISLKDFAATGKFEFDALLANPSGYAYSSFEMTTFALGTGQINPEHRRFETAVYANMLFDPLFTPLKLKPLVLGVEGVVWDATNRRYQDIHGVTVPVGTD